MLSSLFNVFYVVFFTNVLSITVLTLWVAPPLKCSATGIGFNGAETNCRIAHISGILRKNSYEFQILLEATFIYSLSLPIIRVDQQNRTTAKREPELLIMSMITD